MHLQEEARKVQRVRQVYNVYCHFTIFVVPNTLQINVFTRRMQTCRKQIVPPDGFRLAVLRGGTYEMALRAFFPIVVLIHIGPSNAFNMHAAL